MEKTKIVKVKKDSTGGITEVMIETGNVFTLNEAIMLVKDGVIEGLDIGTSQSGREFLCSDLKNTLESLPTF